MLKQEAFKILFVCTGNICRSPTAEGVFLAKVRDAGLAQHVKVDSAGTHGFHAGEAPDTRTIRAAKKRGYDIAEQRARQITKDDFNNFDLILAMDWDNHAHLHQNSGRQYHHKIKLLMSFATEHESAVVPDPYYGGPDGFETVLDYVEDAATNLVDHVRRRLAQKAAA
ncbi:MAG: low molecular weight protein-tyrosine-phosphatase [Burkholderiaceae bacterium]|jgi:protein-tyrosine phosphatase